MWHRNQVGSKLVRFLETAAGPNGSMDKMKLLLTFRECFGEYYPTYKSMWSTILLLGGSTCGATWFLVKQELGPLEKRLERLENEMAQVKALLAEVKALQLRKWWWQW